MNGPAVANASRTERSAARITRGIWRPLFPGALRRYFARDRRAGSHAVTRFKHESERKRIAVAVLPVVADERLRHPELAVGLEIFVLWIVDLRGDGLVARLADQEVQVRGTPVVAPLRAQQH